MTASLVSGRGINTKDTPQSLVPSNSALAYTRPSDWLSMPSITNTDQKFAGLMAIYNDGSNYIALKGTTSSGNYTVDWGDGTSPQTFASGAVASYQYNYASISSGTLTTRGYKQVIITVTPATANLTGIDLQQKYATTPALQNTIALRWLDLKLGSPNLTSLVIGNGSLSLPMVEVFELVSHGSGFTSAVGLFIGMTSLQSVTFNQTYANLSTVTSTSNMFAACYSLKVAPYFITTSVTDMSSMFSGCQNLQSVPAYNSNLVTTMASMFATCYSLKTVPYFNTQNVISTNSMFSSCSELQNVPLYNLIKNQNMAFMFQGCTALKVIPNFNTSNVTNMSSAFFASGVTSMGNVNTSNVTNALSMYGNCTSLNSVGTMDLSKATITANMFQNCSGLITLPTLNTSNVANTAYMFNGCRALTSVPNINTSNVTNFTSMFDTTGLTGIATLSIPKATNIYSVFGTNYALTDVRFTDATATVTNCSPIIGSTGVLSVTGLNGNSVTAAANMFAGATTFVSLANLGISNVRVSLAVNNCAFSTTALESLMANSLINNTASTQTFSQNNNPGATPVVSKAASGITANSNVITMANTVGITTGMYVYGTGLQSGIPVTFTDSTDRVTYTNAASNQPLQDGTRVMFTAITSTTGISINTTYWVVNSLTTGFQLSAIYGGGAIALTTNGTGTMTIGTTTGSALPTIVQTVNANANIIISGVAGLTNASATVTARVINTTLASVKNWTVSG